jgi:hypothetical protein
MAHAHVVVRPAAPAPDPGCGAETDRPARTILRFRAWRADAAEAVQVVQAAVDAYLAAAGDQARLLGPAVAVPARPSDG